jgi:hypothetical protein
MQGTEELLRVPTECKAEGEQLLRPSQNQGAEELVEVLQSGSLAVLPFFCSSCKNRTLFPTISNGD